MSFQRKSFKEVTALSLSLCFCQPSRLILPPTESQVVKSDQKYNSGVTGRSTGKLYFDCI